MIGLFRTQAFLNWLTLKSRLALKLLFFQIVYQAHSHLTKCFLVFKKVWKDPEEGGTNSVEVGKVKTMEDMEKNIFQTIEQSLAKEAAAKKPDVN